MSSVFNAIGSLGGAAMSGVNPSWAPSAGAVGPWPAFADGGVVTRPTAFAMSGGMGLMGEAGPEAILPLRRGADGKLGVASAGGGAAINQTINVNVAGSGGPGMGGNVGPDQARIIAAEVQKAARAAAEDAIRTNMRLGGMLNPSSGRAA
jgi:phage-related minor tail protein